jgi:hypothetical protein
MKSLLFSPILGNRSVTASGLVETPVGAGATVPLQARNGGRDAAVSDFMARFAVDYRQTPGKRNGEAFIAGPGADHRDTFVHATIGARSWIDQRVAKPSAPAR